MGTGRAMRTNGRWTRANIEKFKRRGKKCHSQKKKRTMMIQSKNVPSNGRIEGKTKKD